MRWDTIGMRLHDHSSIRSLYLHQKDEECIEKKFGSVQAKSPQPLPVLIRISSEIGAAEQRLGKPGAVQAKSRLRGKSDSARHMGIKGGPRKGTAGSREGSPGAPWPRCSSSCRADPVSCGGGGGGEALPGRCQVGGEGSRVAHEHESGGEILSTCFAAPRTPRWHLSSRQIS